MFGYQLDWGAFAGDDNDVKIGKNDNNNYGSGSAAAAAARRGQDGVGDGAGAVAGAGAGAGAGAHVGKNRIGRRADLIYVLPGVLLTTEEMKSGGASND